MDASNSPLPSPPAEKRPRREKPTKSSKGKKEETDSETMETDDAEASVCREDLVADDEGSVMDNDVTSASEVSCVRSQLDPKVCK